MSNRVGKRVGKNSGAKKGVEKNFGKNLSKKSSSKSAVKNIGKSAYIFYKEVDKSLFKIKQIQINELNKKLSALQRVVDEDTYKDILENLNLPSSDFITKTGKVSASKKLWDSVDSKELKSLIKKSNDLMDIKQLREEAKETLEKTGFIYSIKDTYKEEKEDLKRLVEEGEIDEETRKILGKELKKQYNAQIKEMVDLEVKSKFKVEKNINESMQDWYDFIKEFGSILASEYPQIIELDKFIYSDGLKSYTELYSWMQDAEDIINKALRG